MTSQEVLTVAPCQPWLTPRQRCMLATLKAVGGPWVAVGARPSRK